MGTALEKPAEYLPKSRARLCIRRLSCIHKYRSPTTTADYTNTTWFNIFFSLRTGCTHAVPDISVVRSALGSPLPRLPAVVPTSGHRSPRSSTRSSPQFAMASGDPKGPNSATDLEVAAAPKRSSWLASAFGGENVVIGPRIEPVAKHLVPDDSDVSSSTSVDIVGKQVASEEGNAIKYRTCSWQKTAGLLFSEYIVLSIMSFPWSYSLLGLVPGLILTVVVALLVLYTSLVLWEFCLRHPEVRDVCDVGQMLWWNKRWAWWWTASMFVLNNTFIQALHVLVGAIYMNTMTEADTIHACRTVAFAVAVTVLSWLGSLPRTFSMLSKLAFGSVFFTFTSVILAAAFSGAQGKPAGYPSSGEPIVSIWTPSSTTLVTGMSAFMNMSYTFIGQTTLPSFIAEMRDPR